MDEQAVEPVLLAAAARQGRKLPADPQQQQKLLAGLTHLHLDGLRLTHLLISLKACPKLQVLYAHDNLLSSLDGISSSKLLTHVYAHNNQLTSLQGLQHLPRLLKLFVQNNRLSCIDCLHTATQLQELHVSHQQPWAAVAAGALAGRQQSGQQVQGQQQPQQLGQQELLIETAAAAHGNQSHHQQQQQQQASANELVLINDGYVMQPCFGGTPSASPSGDTQDAADAEAAAATHADILHSSCQATVHLPSLCGLLFEPATLAAIAGSLRVLAAADCGIQDPGPLAVLTQLHILDLAGNAISDLSLLQPVLRSLGRLQDLDLRRNPCMHARTSRDCVILAAASSLQQLDGVEVLPAHRQFLQTLHSRNALRQQHAGALLPAKHGTLFSASHSEQSCGVLTAAASGSPSSSDCTADGVDAGSSSGAAAALGAVHAAHLTPRSRAAAGAACSSLGTSKSGALVAGCKLQLQLPVALQAAKPGSLRPTAAGGFKPAPKKAVSDKHAAAGQL